LSDIKRVLEKLKQKSSISRGVTYAERCGKWRMSLLFFFQYTVNLTDF
jgi:hypothetical protein